MEHVEPGQRAAMLDQCELMGGAAADFRQDLGQRAEEPLHLISFEL